jgi:uncharacterized MAPEG superfamily protein
MSRELFWLTLTTAMTALFWVPYILDRIMVREPAGAMANPSPRDKPQSAWAQRMMAAHTNAIENLVIFACAVYLWARVVHFAVYTAGIPVARTLAFTVGWVAQAVLVLAIFRLV